MKYDGKIVGQRNCRNYGGNGGLTALGAPPWVVVLGFWFFGFF